jgi:hypothetical protein
MVHGHLLGSMIPPAHSSFTHPLQLIRTGKISAFPKIPIMSQPTGPKTKTGHVLSEADLAKQQARKAQKAAKKAAGKNANEEPILAQGTPRILKRDWIDLKRGEGEGNEGEKRLRVVTWNMLAQTLVRECNERVPTKYAPGLSCWLVLQAETCSLVQVGFNLIIVSSRPNPLTYP